MGGGKWDDDLYNTATTARRAAGVDDFDYSRRVQTGEAAAKVHPDLDPTKISAIGRESRDSMEHPDSVAMAVMFDVTGSMAKTPQEMQGQLPGLMDAVIAKANLRDIQICYGAVGDWTSDDFPFQIGQFESDNRCDDQLRNIILEGGGGGGNHESYHLGFYFAARKTVADCFLQRGKKGYLFTIGDEKGYPKARIDEIKAVFGDDIPADIPIKTLVEEVATKWVHFHIIPQNTSYRGCQENHTYWENLVGAGRVISVADAADICEVIAGLVAMMETSQDAETVASTLGLTGINRRNVVAALSQARTLATCVK